MGLDPSLRNWGVAVGYAPINTGILRIDVLDTIRTQPKPTDNKLPTSTWDIQSANSLYNGVMPYLVDADIICVEVPYGSQDVKSAVGRGICLGVLGSLFSNKMIFVTPQSLKKIVGSPEATKQEVVKWASSRHPEAPWPTWNNKISVTKAEHAADAVTAIYAAAQTKVFKSIIQEHKHANPN